MSKVTGSSSAGSIKRLLYTNVVTLIVITCVLCVGPFVSTNLSVVANVKLVVEVLCCYLLAVSLVLGVSLTDAELPPYKSRRAISSKVKHATKTNVAIFCRVIITI